MFKSTIYIPLGAEGFDSNESVQNESFRRVRFADNLKQIFVYDESDSNDDAPVETAAKPVGKFTDNAERFGNGEYNNSTILYLPLWTIFAYRVGAEEKKLNKNPWI